ncbi:MAG TPA: glucosidase, partial [Anaerolineae bacterium]|nr:glucosidase [Anaerolineae bacterium]
YLADRAWGTVREDYSANGDAWNYLSHDQSRSRAYRWNEDGIGGICDRMQYLCFGLALWNGKDPILKERFFGLSGPEGNHGEDVKEYYFYLDSTPTHSYMKMLYKYPQAEFPYWKLIDENKQRDRNSFEYELLDTGVFNDSRYFDVFIEYAKAAPDDILIKISIANRSPEAAELDVLPQLWFRNEWSWGKQDHPKPQLRAINETTIHANHAELGERWLYCNNGRVQGLGQAQGLPLLLFTENESNKERLWSAANDSPYVKDAFHDYVVNGKTNRVNSDRTGSKAAAQYHLTIDAGQTIMLTLRLSDKYTNRPFDDFDSIFATRIKEADEFYRAIQAPALSDDEKNVQRQAFAGLMWSKQFYHYNVERWLYGDPIGPPPPIERQKGRNHEWTQVDSRDIISMPDKWEYPWFAAWDLAFHTIAIALIDPEFAKRQLLLMLREWYMHPNGQIPAYEWEFGDVKPPVHAWAAWRVYKIDKKHTGVADTDFLERIFHKLLLNFTWWVNRKDAEGNNVFQGGFLGL